MNSDKNTKNNKDIGSKEDPDLSIKVNTDNKIHESVQNLQEDIKIEKPMDEEKNVPDPKEEENNEFIKTLEKLIDSQSHLENENLFEFKRNKNEALYSLVDLYVTSSIEYSTDNEWNQLLKKAKFMGRLTLAMKILSLKERRWNKENIILSDIIKDNRENLDSYMLIKYLNLRLKLQEHFSWLVWAISYYYYYNLLINGSKDGLEDCDLPQVEHVDWINGFEWKGMYIRVQTEDQSKYVFEEIKALNYLFFEYIQIIDNYKNKSNESEKLLSNELIFPLISIAKTCSLVIIGSVCINKYNYELFEPSVFNPNIKYEPKKDNKYNESKINLSNDGKANRMYSNLQNSLKNSQSIRYNIKRTISNNYCSNANSYDISHIMNEGNNSYHSVNISQNINKDININQFSKGDLINSVLFSNINETHLMKVIDDINDNYYSHNPNDGNFPKSKFMIISAVDLIPNFVKSKPNFIKINQNIMKGINHLNGDQPENYVKNILDNPKTISHYENHLMNILFKIYHNEDENIPNQRTNDYFVNIYSRNVNLGEKQNLFSENNYQKFLYMKSNLIENCNYIVKGDCVMMYSLSYDIKYKYSLLKSDKKIDYDYFINKTNYGNYIENFSKILDNNFNLDNPNSLKRFFHKYGVNTGMEIFILPKLRNVKISNLIKLNILCKLIKNVINFNEGQNFITKILLINLNSNSYKFSNNQILRDGFFDFINEKTIYDIRRVKIYFVIMSILHMAKSNKSFINFFYESINIALFTKWLKWKNLSQNLNFPLYPQTNLIHELLSSARDNPLLFLNSLEYHLNMTIDPMIKFKASISLENFTHSFIYNHIIEKEPSLFSYINTKELSFYLLSKCIYASRSSTKYDNYKDNVSEKKTNCLTNTQDSRLTNTLNNAKIFKNKIINQPNAFSTKINIDGKNDISRGSNINSGIQMNVTCNVSIDYQPENICKKWEALSNEMDYLFPSILYKVLMKYEENRNAYKNLNINRNLKHFYSFSKIDIVKDWKSNCEMLLNDIVTVDSSEVVLIQPLIILFINSFLIDIDYNYCKEIIYKIKDIMKGLNYYKFEFLSVVNLLEGLLTERKNYVDCESFYSKCLIFALLLYGDPRGRGCYGNNFLLYPLWKIGRQTCILDNPLTNENFREMFHSQDYMFKNMLNNNKVNSLFDNNINYTNSQLFTKKTESNINISDIYFDEEINEYHNDDLYISEKNFLITKIKYFAFPSISDIKTSYNNYFQTESFIAFLMRNMLLMDNLSSNSYDEEVLTKLNMNCYPVNMSIDFTSKLSYVVDSKTHRKEKGNIFSSFMYDILLDKLNYKKNAPNYILLSWGANMHNETSHNNYDYLSLPRVCYKLKDEEIVNISCGWEHNLALTYTKRCYAWGNNQSGQCGVGGMNTIFNPFHIDELVNIKQLACGNDHSVALLENGDLYSWGKSEGGVLGYIDKEIEYIPKRIKSLKNVEKVYVGSLHNIAISEGKIYSWGCGEGGQLGLSEEILTKSDIPGCTSNPTIIETLNGKKIIKVSCGEAHTLAISSDGSVYGWGFTSNGQLGMGFCADSFEPGTGMMHSRILKPTQISIDNYNIKDVICGKTFSSFITDKLEVLVCGVNDLNQLGIEQPKSTKHIYKTSDLFGTRCMDVVIPIPIECFTNMKVKKIACGESHCLAVIEDQSNKFTTLWSWGNNKFGQLGQGNQVLKSMPKPINYILGYIKSQIIEIGCGGFHSMCIMSNDSFSYNKKEENNRLNQVIYDYCKSWIIE